MKSTIEVLSKRNVSVFIVFMRFLFFTAIFLVIFLFKIKLVDYAIFLIILSIPAFIIHIDQVLIFKEKIFIQKHLVFSLLVKTYNIDIDRIVSITTKQDVIELDSAGGIDDEIAYIIPTETIVSYITEIIYTENNKEKTTRIKLKENEYKLALELFNKREKS